MPPKASHRAAVDAAAEPLVDADDLGALLANLYRAIEDPQGMRDFLAGCVAALAAFSGSIVMVDRSGRVPRFIACHPHFGAAAETYVGRYDDDDPLLAAVLLAEPGRAYLLEELIDADQRATHPYFTHWAVENDVGDVLTSRVPFGNTLELTAGFLRRRAAPPFGEPERALLNLLLPHMAQANALHLQLDRLGVFADIAQEQMFHAGQGLAVLDQDGQLLYANPLACRVLRESGAFRFETGVLTLRDHQLGLRFTALRKRCANASAGENGPSAGAVQLPVEDGSTLLVTVLPYQPRSAQGFFREYAARVLLVISRDHPTQIDTRGHLRKMFDLTAVETDVFWRVGNGQSVEEIAERTGQSTETVRGRLKRIFAKTGVSRQSDLVRLMVHGVPGWTNPGAVLP